MGKSFHYICCNCGYEAVASGGKDYGRNITVQTMICVSCKVVIDVVLQTVIIDELGQFMGWQDEQGQCPKCKLEYLKIWRHPWPCPKCDGKMSESEEPVRYWD